MDCDIPQLEFTSLLQRLAGDRRPYACTLELTRRCNNRCVHCYVDPVEHDQAPERTTDFWLGLLDALAVEQCFWLTLTGGDPLMRPDFATIYEAAKRKGMAVAVFTNARLITEQLADLMYELPPRAVSVTLYGATRETYDRVAGCPGAYDQAMAGLQRLHQRGITVQLKTVAMRSNVHELDLMRAYAESMGWYFWFDARIVPERDGDPMVLAERLSPEEVVALDLTDPDRRSTWEAFGREVGPMPADLRVNACSAGTVNAFVTSTGAITPCSIMLYLQWPLDETDLLGSLRKAFYEDMPRAIYETAEGPFPCGECDLRRLCRACPAWRVLEEGSADRPCRYSCQVTKLRAAALGVPYAPPASALP